MWRRESSCFTTAYRRVLHSILELQRVQDKIFGRSFTCSSHCSGTPTPVTLAERAEVAASPREQWKGSYLYFVQLLTPLIRQSEQSATQRRWRLSARHPCHPPCLVFRPSVIAPLQPSIQPDTAAASD